MRKEQVKNMAEEKKAQYEKPASQVDLEERLARGNRSRAVLTTADNYEPPGTVEGREFAVEGNDLEGYIGVSPEYATYASETEAPVLPESETAEEKVASEFAADIAPLSQMKGLEPEGQESDTEVNDPGDDGDDGEKPPVSGDEVKSEEQTAAKAPAKSTPAKKTASSSNS